MLSQITWTDYAGTVVAITVFYYIVTVTHFYRYEIAYFFSAKDKTERLSFTSSNTDNKPEEV